MEESLDRVFAIWVTRIIMDHLVFGKRGVSTRSRRGSRDRERENGKRISRRRNSLISRGDDPIRERRYRRVGEGGDRWGSNRVF